MKSFDSSEYNESLNCFWFNVWGRFVELLALYTVYQDTLRNFFLK